MKSFNKSLFILLIAAISIYSQTGSIEGFTLDKTTMSPLIGTNVILINTTIGASSDSEGKFVIKNVPVGSYTIQFRMIGYKTITKTDVIVRSSRVTNVSADLSEHALETDQVVVNAGYFKLDDTQPLSITSLSGEEIRRAPGSGGDVSRVLMSLPSLAKVNDQSNSLIVRGGSPLENAFYIDGIEIPNINHFPTQGATGGPIGMINVDLIDDVNFYTGGFSASYGDKLSSILNLKFREGNRNNFDGQLDLSIMGFGGVAEGPLGRNGSYLFSLRRSYLNYLVKLFDVGTTTAPSYGDFQGKIVYDLSPKHRLSFLTLNGDDHNNPSKTDAEENDMLYYGRQEVFQNAGGVVWRALWNNDFYSNTSLSYQATTADEKFFETNTDFLVLKNKYTEGSINFRSLNFLRFSETNSIPLVLILMY